MRMRGIGLVGVGLLLCLTGCLETQDAFTLNPDGSGKVVHTAFFQPMNLTLDNKPPADPAADLKKAAREELTKSSGIEAWKDVAYERTDDGRIRFSGTAYFKDLNRLKIHNGGTDVAWKPAWSNAANGQSVLAMVFKEKKDKAGTAPTAPPTGDALAAKIKEQKGQYQQSKPMLAAMLTGLKMDLSFRLPAAPTETLNFKTTAPDTLQLTLDGAKLIEAIDALTQDDAWWQSQIQAGCDFKQDGPPMDERMHEKMFGRKAPVRATLAAGTKPLFDYTAEVAAAKPAHEAALKALQAPVSAPAGAPAAGGGGAIGVQRTEVLGVQIVRRADMQGGIQPFNSGKPSYALALATVFSGPVLKATEGRLERAITDAGENLTERMEHEWDRQIHFPRLAEDRQTAVFEVKLDLPPDSVKGFKEIAGTLTFETSAGTKEVDLGVAAFAAGAQGKEYGAVIEALKESQFDKDQQEVTLQLSLPAQAVQAIRFFDAGGQALEVKPSWSSGGDDTCTKGFTLSGPFPKTGRIVADIHTERQAFTAPFAVTNISLLGLPAAP